MTNYDASEQDILLDEFMLMLREVTKDGGNKRAAGLKPPWWKDPSHWKAVFSHINKYMHGEKHDKDSDAHPMVHGAWRMLAIAYQETKGKVDPALKRRQIPLSEDRLQLERAAEAASLAAVEPITPSQLDVIRKSAEILGFEGSRFGQPMREHLVEKGCTCLSSAQQWGWWLHPETCPYWASRGGRI